MHLFTPFEVREVTARNRVMLSPMCQYSCEAGDGLATDWHRVHLGSRAVGGARIVMTEATAVTPRGRISPQDLGIWSDAHAEALSPAAAFVADHGAVPAIQLAHAGRKTSKRRPADGSDPIHGDGGWTPVGPTAEPWPHGEPLETERLSTDAIAGLVDDSARLAADLGPLGVDLVDVSAGGVHPDQEGPDTGPHYQMPYAERVAESGVPVGAVGGIATPEGADAIVRNGRADLVVVGREHLRDPYFAIRTAQQLGHEAPVPRQYTRGFE